jgi:hypothetical protein
MKLLIKEDTAALKVRARSFVLYLTWAGFGRASAGSLALSVIGEKHSLPFSA